MIMSSPENGSAFIGASLSLNFVIVCSNHCLSFSPLPNFLLYFSHISTDVHMIACTCAELLMLFMNYYLDSPAIAIESRRGCGDVGRCSDLGGGGGGRHFFINNKNMISSTALYNTAMKFIG